MDHMKYHLCFFVNGLIILEDFLDCKPEEVETYKQDKIEELSTLGMEATCIMWAVQ
jgi:hypothetical protein